MMSNDAEGVNSASYPLIYLMHTPIIITHPPKLNVNNTSISAQNQTKPIIITHPPN